MKTILFFALVTAAIMFTLAWIYELGVSAGIDLYRPETKGPRHYYIGTGVRLTYDDANDTIYAETMETYDVSTYLPQEHILNLLESLEKRACEQYFGGNQFVSIVKRHPKEPFDWSEVQVVWTDRGNCPRIEAKEKTLQEISHGNTPVPPQ